jgi:hypothetical protein
MGARQKLNAAYLMGNLILALLAGGATGSLLVGLAVFALTGACSLSNRDIRLEGRKHQRP